MNIISTIRENKTTQYIITYAFCIAMFLIAFLAIPAGKEPSGAILFLPAIFLLVFIFTTRRMIEGFVWANLLLFFMISRAPLDTIYGFVDGIYGTISNEDYQWIIMIATAIGGLSLLIKISGSSKALTNLMLKIKGKRRYLIISWFIQAALFIDDFIHVMIMGPTLLPVAKERGVSKEMFTYVLKATGVALGVCLPVSMWSFFIMRQLESSGLAAPGESVTYFLHMIPLNFFAWISVIVSLLVVIGIIPLFGPMKKAEALGEQQVFSEGPEPEIEEVETPRKKPRLINIILPIVVLLAFIFILDFDSATAAVIALLFTFVLYMVQGLLSPEEFEEGFLTGGIREMAFMFIVILFSMTFSYGLETLGFVEYIIDLVGGSGVSPIVFPMLLFAIFSLTEFAVGLNWSLFIISFPMILPLAEAVGSDPLLCVSAIVSAAVVGVNCGFVSDMTILSCAFTNTKPMDHVLANLPFQLIAWPLALIGFLIAGFIMV